jgi:hypothetical protein
MMTGQISLIENYFASPASGAPADPFVSRSMAAPSIQALSSLTAFWSKSAGYCF